MAEMGRPRKEIDFNEFEKLCHIQCTAEEIAAFFSISVDTLYRRIAEKYECTFAEVFDEKRKGGLISLRRSQWQSVQKGNIVMQIWLGKQYLGQKDKQEIEQTNKTIEIKIGEDEKDA